MAHQMNPHHHPHYYGAGGGNEQHHAAPEQHHNHHFPNPHHPHPNDPRSLMSAYSNPHHHVPPPAPLHPAPPPVVEQPPPPRQTHDNDSDNESNVPQDYSYYHRDRDLETPRQYDPNDRDDQFDNDDYGDNNMDDQTDPLGGAGDQNPLGDTEEDTGGGGDDNDPYARASVIERTSSYEQTLYRDNENSNDKEQPVAYNNEKQTSVAAYNNERERGSYQNEREPYQNEKQSEPFRNKDYRKDHYEGGNVENDKKQNKDQDTFQDKNQRYSEDRSPDDARDNHFDDGSRSPDSEEKQIDEEMNSDTEQTANDVSDNEEKSHVTVADKVNEILNLEEDGNTAEDINSDTDEKKEDSFKIDDDKSNVEKSEALEEAKTEPITVDDKGKVLKLKDDVDIEPVDEKPVKKSAEPIVEPVVQIQETPPDPRMLKEMRRWAKFNKQLEHMRKEQVKEEVEAAVIKEEVLESDGEDSSEQFPSYVATVASTNGNSIKFKKTSTGKKKKKVKEPKPIETEALISEMTDMDYVDYSEKVKGEDRIKEELHDYESELLQFPDEYMPKKKRKKRGPPKERKEPGIRKRVKKEYDTLKMNCEECNKTFKSNLIYRQHIKRVHTNIPLKCDICNKNCPDKTKLHEHRLRIHTSEIESEQGFPLPRYTCDICPEGTSPVYVVARDLAKHNHVKHSGIPKKPPPTENQHFCDLCGKGYKKKWPLVLHMRRHSGEKPFTCDKCAKAFFLKGDLKRHYDINHAAQTESYICNTCGKTYTNVHNFKVHERSHFKRENIKCNECGETFTEKSSLRKHMYYHGDPQFHCKLCNTDIRTPDLMKQHLTGQHGLSPFSCEICQHECLSREEKKLHQIHFHQESGFQCKLCMKEFMTERHLLVHMRRHTKERKYRCDECPKAYASNVALNAHISTVHKGEKNFVCDICEKSFGRYNNLHSHKLTHSGIKPFQCVYCSSGYAEKRNLMNHITRNHPGQPLDFKRECVKTE